jgi:ubiquinol-cytochrome c reductase cytochrome c subunit
MARATPPNTANGPQIFAQHCATCHGPNGQGESGAVTMAGPSLQAEHNPGWIMAAEEIGPSHMPSFVHLLTSEQMRAVAHYVATRLAVIPVRTGNRAHGSDLFRFYCEPCHGPAVRGGDLVYAGTNAPSLAGLSPELIEGAIRMGPGPMPAFPPAVISDHDLASIADYIRTIQQPAHPGGYAMHWFGPTPEALAGWAGVVVLMVFTVWAERGGKG